MGIQKQYNSNAQKQTHMCNGWIYFKHTMYEICASNKKNCLWNNRGFFLFAY